MICDSTNSSGKPAAIFSNILHKCTENELDSDVRDILSQAVKLLK